MSRLHQSVEDSQAGKAAPNDKDMRGTVTAFVAAHSTPADCQSSHRFEESSAFRLMPGH